jgi:hypothetical protein
MYASIKTNRNLNNDYGYYVDFNDDDDQHLSIVYELAKRRAVQQEHHEDDMYNFEDSIPEKYTFPIDTVYQEEDKICVRHSTIIKKKPDTLNMLQRALIYYWYSVYSWLVDIRFLRSNN